MHVPLIVAGPSVVRPGRTNTSLINATDLFATTPELCSYSAWREAVPKTTTIDAVSFLPIIKDDAVSVRSWAFSEQFTKPAIPADAKTIRNERYQLLHFDTGSEEFYDLIADPLENTDLLLGKLTATRQENDASLCSQMKTLTGVGTCQTVSVELSTDESVVTVHPNPATTHVRLRSSADIRRIVISDLQGRERDLPVNEQISIAELGIGTYVLRISYIDGKESVQTLVVER